MGSLGWYRMRFESSPTIRVVMSCGWLWASTNLLLWPRYAFQMRLHARTDFVTRISLGTWHGHPPAVGGVKPWSYAIGASLDNLLKYKIHGLQVLALGVVPVVLRSPLDRLLSTFPRITIDRWTDFSLQNMKRYLYAYISTRFRVRPCYNVLGGWHISWKILGTTPSQWMCVNVWPPDTGLEGYKPLPIIYLILTKTELF